MWSFERVGPWLYFRFKECILTRIFLYRKTFLFQIFILFLLYGAYIGFTGSFLNETFTTMKVWKKNANLRQLWTQLPNSVKFFYLTHRYVKKPISQCTVGAQIDTYIFALACMNIKDVHKHFITFNQHFCWLNMPADFMFFL